MSRSSRKRRVIWCILLAAGATLFGILISYRVETAFDLHSGRIRERFSVMGIQVKQRVIETPLSELVRSLSIEVDCADWGFPWTRDLLCKYDRHLLGRALADSDNLVLALKLVDCGVERERRVVAEFLRRVKDRDFEGAGALPYALVDEFEREQGSQLGKERRNKGECSGPRNGAAKEDPEASPK